MEYILILFMTDWKGVPHDAMTTATFNNSYACEKAKQKVTGNWITGYCVQKGVKGET